MSGRSADELSLSDAIHELREEVLDTESPIGITRAQGDQLTREGVLDCEMVVYEYAKGPKFDQSRVEEVCGL